jgi:hypothetical protein
LKEQEAERKNGKEMLFIDRNKKFYVAAPLLDMSCIGE